MGRQEKPLAELVKILRATYPKGSRVVLVQMDDIQAPPWYTKELNDLVAQMDERTRQEVLKIFRTVAARNHRTPTITQELYELIFRGLKPNIRGSP